MRIIFLSLLIWGCPYFGKAQTGAPEDSGPNRPREIFWEDLMEDPAFSWFPPAFHKAEADTGLLAALAPHLSSYQYLIFLGAWCSDSHRWIPPLFRIFKDLDLPPQAYRILALDEEKKDGGSGWVDRYQIAWIPTIVLLRDGVERGRIVETVEASMEAALLDIIIEDLEGLEIRETAPVLED